MGLRQIDLDKQKSVRFCAHSRRSAVASATNFLKRGVRIHSGAFLFNRERSFLLNKKMPQNRRLNSRILRHFEFCGIWGNTPGFLAALLSQTALHLQAEGQMENGLCHARQGHDQNGV